METIIKFFFLFLTTINLAFSQKNDTIYFHFDKNTYMSIAKDSIRKLYDNQYNYFYNKKESYDISRLMSFNSKFEELNFFLIPMYRLYRDGYEKYDCSKNIENFIDFNEYNKYQMVYVCTKNNLYSIIEVPNRLIEQDKIYTSFKEKNKNEFLFTSYLETLLANKEVIKSKTIRIFNADVLNNFFFKLYGLEDVIFELDKKTGVLYANIYHDEIYGIKERKLPVNDFIRKYVGEKVIKELCLGHYLEVDPSLNPDYYSSCKNLENRKSDKIFLKIIEAK